MQPHGLVVQQRYSAEPRHHLRPPDYRTHTNRKNDGRQAIILATKNAEAVDNISQAKIAIDG
jgi:hypothetical protein